MNKIFCSVTALAAVMAAIPVAAHATDGFYGKVEGGYSFQGRVKSENGVATGDNFSGSTKLKNGALQDIGFGYAMTSGPRFELEFAHRFNKYKTSQGPVGYGYNGGRAHVWSLMGNAFYDFNKGGWFQPYIGAGVGYAEAYARSSSPFGAQTYNDHSSKLAYQAMAGVAFPMSERLTLDVGYRWFTIPHEKFIGTQAFGATAASYKGLYSQQTATIGLRWQFSSNEPPPPPPPPPAPPPPPEVAAPVVQACPAQDFKVYFEWDRATLNQAARETISAAAAQAASCNVSTVRVVGYTDTSGSPNYNLALSQRRANVVRDALVGAGMNAGAITTEGAGENNLAKPTGDGVREPLNRRSEVTISFQ